MVATISAPAKSLELENCAVKGEQTLQWKQYNSRRIYGG
jgi:hypothetical protein